MARKKKSTLGEIFSASRKASSRNIAGGQSMAKQRKTAKNIRKVASKVNRSIVKAGLKNKKMSLKNKAKLAAVGTAGGLAMRAGIGAVRAASKAGSTVGSAQRLAKVAGSSFRIGKTAGLKKRVSANSADSRRLQNQFSKVNSTGAKRKGNIGGKAAALGGALAGAAVGRGSYKLTAARKAALKKAQQISARMRKGKKR